MSDMDVAYWMAKYDRLREKYGELNCDYAAALDKINELEDRWISVDDRLPENRNDVLVVISLGIMFVAWYDSFYNNEWMYDGVTLHNVTYWMPLPQPPEKESDTE